MPRSSEKWLRIYYTSILFCPHLNIYTFSNRLHSNYSQVLFRGCRCLSEERVSQPQAEPVSTVETTVAQTPEEAAGLRQGLRQGLRHRQGGGNGATKEGHHKGDKEHTLKGQAVVRQ